MIRLLVTLLLAAAVNDGTIYDQVRVKLAADRDVGRAAIEVRVENGAVELRGNVRNEKAKSRAEKLARKVKGVQKVVNNLTIGPVQP